MDYLIKLKRTEETLRKEIYEGRARKEKKKRDIIEHVAKLEKEYAELEKKKVIAVQHEDLKDYTECTNKIADIKATIDFEKELIKASAKPFDDEEMFSKWKEICESFNKETEEFYKDFIKTKEELFAKLVKIMKMYNVMYRMQAHIFNNTTNGNEDWNVLANGGTFNRLPILDGKQYSFFEQFLEYETEVANFMDVNGSCWEYVEEL